VRTHRTRAAVVAPLTVPRTFVVAAAALGQVLAAAESAAPQVERMLREEGQLAAVVGVAQEPRASESRLCLCPLLASKQEGYCDSLRLIQGGQEDEARQRAV
jgi:hypothetical protein